MDTTKLIRELDDNSARYILAAVAKSRLAEGAEQVDATPEVVRSLGEALGIDEGDAGASEGDVARAALMYLAVDATTATSIESLAKGPKPELYDAGLSIAVGAAVLIVLQTHVKFHRNTDGKWTLTVEKKPTADGLVMPLIKKTLALFSI